MPNLRNLVIFYSIFSSGSVLEKSPSERDVCLALHEILDLNLSYDDPHLAAWAGKLKSHFARWNPEIEGQFGFLPKITGFVAESYGAEQRARDHLKLNDSDEALLYLFASLTQADRLGHKVLLVIPPARSDYKRACGTPSTHLFRSLSRLRQELEITSDFKILNLFEDDDFVDGHFGDFDHLNPRGDGARILSQKVSETLAAWNG